MSLLSFNHDRIKNRITTPGIFASAGFIVTIFVTFLTGFICFNYISSYSSASLGTTLLITFVISALYFFLEYFTVTSWEKPLLRVFLINIHALFSAFISVLVILFMFEGDVSNVLDSNGFYGHVGFAGRLDALRQVLTTQPFAQLLGVSFFLMFLSLQALPVINSTIVKQKAEIQEVKTASQKTINNLFEKQVQAFSYVQHELGNKLPAVSNEFAFLKKLIATNTSKFNLTTKVREPLGDEDSSTIDTVNDVLNRIEEGLNYSIHSLQNSGSIISANKQQLNFEEVNLQHFLKVICKKIISDTANVECQFSGDDDAIVKIDRSQFSTVINNIVSNALNHGFRKMNADNKIAFNVKRKKTKVELIIKNNGEPFDESFTIDEYLTPHRYSGENGKSGMGGYFIGIILNKHNANISLLPYEQNEEFKVKFLITFEKEGHEDN